MSADYLFSFGSVNDKMVWALQVEHSMRVTREHIKRTEKLLDQLNESLEHADKLSTAAKLSAARELMSSDHPRTVKELRARVAARVLRASADMANAEKKAADAANEEIPSDYDDMGQLESAVTKEDNPEAHEDTAQLENEIVKTAIRAGFISQEAQDS